MGLARFVVGLPPTNLLIGIDNTRRSTATPDCQNPQQTRQPTVRTQALFPSRFPFPVDLEGHRSLDSLSSSFDFKRSSVDFAADAAEGPAVQGGARQEAEGRGGQDVRAQEQEQEQECSKVRPEPAAIRPAQT